LLLSIYFCFYQYIFLKRTGNGYLVDPSIWSEEVMVEMEKEDDIELTESMVSQIMAAREYFAENSSVPQFINCKHKNHFCGFLLIY
jgi:sulfur relay (sulfurtransferase) DsrC/TusE family protein